MLRLAWDVSVSLGCNENCVLRIGDNMEKEH